MAEPTPIAVPYPSDLPGLDPSIGVTPPDPTTPAVVPAAPEPAAPPAPDPAVVPPPAQPVDTTPLVELPPITVEASAPRTAATTTTTAAVAPVAPPPAPVSTPAAPPPTAPSPPTNRSLRQSVGRRPRGIVRINGTDASFLSFKVDNKTHFSCDTWSVEMECWNQPEGFGIGFFDSSQNTIVEILIGFLTARQGPAGKPSGAVSLIVGQVDDIDLDLNTGKLTLSGRDYTAKLIDTKTANKWPDQTSSQIVTTLAQQVGLTVQATATTTPVREYYQNAYTNVARDVPMWDLIKFLADQEGFDAYVTGTTVYFGPPQADTNSDPFPVLIRRDPATGAVVSTAKRVSLRRSETVAKDLAVTVISHGYAKGKGVKAVASRAGSSPGGSSASNRSNHSAQSYVIRRPNLTQDQAQQLANSMLLDLTKREKTAEIECEGDPAMNVRRRVKISGTGTAFDLDYYVSELSQAYSTKGYEMRMSLKNHPTASQESTV